MDLVFLDANVLFSAAYRPRAGLLRLWEVADAELVTSAYAAHEARRNLSDSAQRERLERVLASVRTVPEAEDRPLPQIPGLPDQDRPILLAAVAAGATHLATGDVTHFGRHLRRQVEAVLVLTPAQYLRLRQ